MFREGDVVGGVLVLCCCCCCCCLIVGGSETETKVYLGKAEEVGGWYFAITCKLPTYKRIRFVSFRDDNSSDTFFRYDRKLFASTIQCSSSVGRCVAQEDEFSRIFVLRIERDCSCPEMWIERVSCVVHTTTGEVIGGNTVDIESEESFRESESDGKICSKGRKSRSKGTKSGLKLNLQHTIVVAMIVKMSL